jgi:tetratricopeptide (TPR) repeat protein
MTQKNILKVFLIPRLLVSAVFIALIFQPLSTLALEINKGAVALLSVKGQNGEVTSTGSGFVVKPEGVLVTNYHVLIDAVAVDAIFPDGTVTPVMEVIDVDRLKDFAILKLGDGFFSTLELGDSNALKEYDYVSALGYLTDEVADSPKPKGKLRKTFGMTLGLHTQADPNFKMIYSTASLGSGFSGGPLVDKDNKVVGISSVEGRALSLALPINEIKSSLEKKSSISLPDFAKRDGIFPQSMYYRGNFVLYGQGEVEEAVELFKKTLVELPEFVLARYDLAVAYRNQGMTEQAIAEYEKAIELNPKFPEALSNLGGQYFRSGDIDKAIKTFKRAVESFPNFIQANSNLGAALNKKNRYEEAIPYLKKTVQLDPEFGIAHFNLGNAYLGIQDLKKARASLEKASNLGVEFISLHWKLFEVHREMGNKEKAHKELEYILEIDPDDEKALEELDREEGV